MYLFDIYSVKLRTDSVQHAADENQDEKSAD